MSDESKLDVESEETLAKDKAEIAQMQDEVIALYKAWVDRGISKLSAAAGITGAGNMILGRLGMPLLDVLEMLVIQRRAIEGDS